MRSDLGMQSDTPRRIVDALTTYHPPADPRARRPDGRPNGARTDAHSESTVARVADTSSGSKRSRQENGWRTAEAIAGDRTTLAFRELQSAPTLWSRPSGFTGVTVRRASSMSWQQTIANARAVSSLLHKSPRLRLGGGPRAPGTPRYARASRPPRRSGRPAPRKGRGACATRRASQNAGSSISPR